MKPTLYTLTGNLLWERTLDFASWAPGKTQRAQAESFQVGGKGINVARMLARLGAPTLALCFTGGSSGTEALAWLNARGLPHHAFPTTSATRTGTVIRAEGQPETTFLGPDAAPDPAAWAACAAYVEKIPAGDVLALCGSFPGWATPAAEPLRTALARRAVRGTLVADTYGPPLAWALQQPLALVKINRDEFDAYQPERSPAEPFATRLSSALAKTRVQAWVVTDGAGPVWLNQPGSPPRSLTPPVVKTVSATGSGDVLLACLLDGCYQRHLALPDALARALPYAAANAAAAGIADFDLNNLPT
jgi:fructose-1-phosphate kinase PfkB-like protein